MVVRFNPWLLINKKGSVNIIIIAAVAKNGVIGKDGKLPWKDPIEMNFFKTTTTGFPIIMGRKTYESVGVLPGRPTFVVSRSLDPTPLEDITAGNKANICNSLENAIFCIKTKLLRKKMFIAGGADLYKTAIDSGIATDMLISRMNNAVEGDTYFPEIPQNWELVGSQAFITFRVEKFKRPSL